jgi:hypothetical protein
MLIEEDIMSSDRLKKVGISSEERLKDKNL